MSGTQEWFSWIVLTHKIIIKLSAGAEDFFWWWGGAGLKTSKSLIRARESAQANMWLVLKKKIFIWLWWALVATCWIFSCSLQDLAP